jgi:DNA-3-methyladenine glycosylase
VVLPQDFYARPVLQVAQDLVGCLLEHDGCLGRIVETEAYHQDEAACHAYVGKTSRTSVLFGAPGTAYVYRSYGIHALLNAVCEPLETGAAVLLRAVEPLEGVAAMRERRLVKRDVDLTNGPGKLTQAFDVELHHNATSLVDGPVRLLAGEPRAPLVAGPRIGITKAVDLPWRFCEQGSPWVSRPLPPGWVRRA